MSFDDIFNIIFNKISNIYTDLFLKIFSYDKYYSIIYSNFICFRDVLSEMFININSGYGYKFFYNSINKYIYVGDFSDYQKEYLNRKIAILLSSDIDNRFLLDIIDNNIKNDYFYELVIRDDNINDLCFSYLICKVLVKVIILLNIYKNNNNIRAMVQGCASKFRTYEMDLSNVKDYYCDNDIISESEFKILVYCIGVSLNYKDINSRIDYNISKLFMSIGFNNDISLIDSYNRSNYYNRPFMYSNVILVIELLFKKYYDDYDFIVNRDYILLKILCIYIKNINLYDKIFICNNYRIWKLEWNGIRDKYL